MKTEDLLTIIEKTLPAATAMEGDKIGLQIQGDRYELRNFLTVLEITQDIINEAVSHSIDCILTFHPLIFNPLVSITDNDRVGSLVKEIIKAGITVISIHTNFDSFKNGTSKILADKLGLKVNDFLVPDPMISNSGMGVIASNVNSYSVYDLLDRVHKVCGSPLRVNKYEYLKEIKTIAIVGGSGSSFINAAIASGVDAFITADISYHNFHRTAEKLMLIDPGHYEMEQFVPEAMAEHFRTVMNEVDYNKIMVTKTLTNPVRYYPMTDIYTEIQTQYIIRTN